MKGRDALITGFVLFICIAFVLATILHKPKNIQEKHQKYKSEPSLSLKEQKAIIKGTIGEEKIVNLIQSLKGNYKILRNIYLEKENGELTEVDIVVFHSSGIHVIESKNYSGWIFGSESDDRWTQKFSNGETNTFYNPIRQNQGHIKAIQRQFNGLRSHMIHSWIVFSDHCELKKVDVYSPNVHVQQLYDFQDEFRQITQSSNAIFDTDDVFSFYLRFLDFKETEDKKQLHRQQVEQFKNNPRNKPTLKPKTNPNYSSNGRSDVSTKHKRNKPKKNSHGFVKGIAVLIVLYFVMSSIANHSTNKPSSQTTSSISQSTSTPTEKSPETPSVYYEDGGNPFLTAINKEIAEKIYASPNQRISKGQAETFISEQLKKPEFQGFEIGLMGANLKYPSYSESIHSYFRSTGKNKPAQTFKIKVKSDDAGIKQVAFFG